MGDDSTVLLERATAPASDTSGHVSAVLPCWTAGLRSFLSCAHSPDSQRAPLAFESEHNAPRPRQAAATSMASRAAARAPSRLEGRMMKSSGPKVFGDVDDLDTSSSWIASPEREATRMIGERPAAVVKPTRTVGRQGSRQYLDSRFTGACARIFFWPVSNGNPSLNVATSVASQPLKVSRLVFQT